MKLYDYPSCPYAQKVKIVLAEKELSYDIETVDLRKGEQKTPDFLQLNPFGKVPVLVDEDVIIYDSTVINEYLEDEYPYPGLRPEDPAARARNRILEEYADQAFTLHVGLLMNEVRKKASDRDPDRIQKCRQDVSRTLAYLNAQLRDQEFLGGEFSLADAAFAPRLLVLKTAGVEIRPEWEALRGWIDRLDARPSVKGLDGFDGWR